MTYQDIHTFLTIASSSSLSKAAESLFVSQPALSHRLSALEEELAERKKTTKILVKENLTGYLKRYSKMVSSADKGAIINRMD